MLTAAPDVSMSIEDCCVASARYWSTPPSVLANTLTRPSSFIRFSRASVSWASGVSNVASVAWPSCPLLLLTTSIPSPLSQFSNTVALILKARGFSETPAALSFLACS
jgi:hypothetical protein